MREDDETGGETDLLGSLLCWFGFHDFRIVEGTFGFGPGGSVEKLECRRCGHKTARQA